MRATLASALLFSALVPLVAQSSTPAPQLTPDQIKAIQAALAPVVTPPVTSVTPGVAEPAQIFTAGGGISGLGPAQPFGYYSMSQHVAAGTYTTEITELVRMKGGTVGTSARAGVSKVLWSFSTVSLGIVGDAGVAEGTTGSASGAVSGRGFLSWMPWKHFGFIWSAQLLNVAGSGQQATITGGIQFRP